MIDKLLLRIIHNRVKTCTRRQVRIYTVVMCDIQQNCITIYITTLSYHNISTY